MPVSCGTAPATFCQSAWCGHGNKPATSHTAGAREPQADWRVETQHTKAPPETVLVRWANTQLLWSGRGCSQAQPRGRDGRPLLPGSAGFPLPSTAPGHGGAPLAMLLGLSLLPCSHLGPVGAVAPSPPLDPALPALPVTPAPAWQGRAWPRAVELSLLLIWGPLTSRVRSGRATPAPSPFAQTKRYR